MKKNLLGLLSATLFLGMVMISPVVNAQQPPHPTELGHGINGNQSPGGTARVGDGAAILIAFAFAYGYRKIKQNKRQVQANANH